METQVIELEKKYWHGMESHDYETVKKLTRFPCLIAGKTGVQSVEEAAFKKMFDSGAGAKIKVIEISDVKTQLIADNGAVIAYLITLGTGDEKPPMKCACTSTWVKEGENWICAMHTESELAQQ